MVTLQTKQFQKWITGKINIGMCAIHVHAIMMKTFATLILKKLIN